MEITEQVRRFFDDRPVEFLQIGAGDGNTADPLVDLIRNNQRWFGVFVEPVPWLLQCVRRLHDNAGRFVYDGCAIADHDGTCNFYHVDPDVQYVPGDRPPPFWHLIGSTNRDLISERWHGKFEPFIKKTMVTCMTLHTLIHRRNLHGLDVLAIDAEGYDARIIQQINFNIIAPHVIIYETEHMTREEELNVTALLMHGHGYTLTPEGNNTLAMR